MGGPATTNEPAARATPAATETNPGAPGTNRPAPGGPAGQMHPRIAAALAEPIYVDSWRAILLADAKSDQEKVTLLSRKLLRVHLGQLSAAVNNLLIACNRLPASKAPIGMEAIDSLKLPDQDRAKLEPTVNKHLTSPAVWLYKGKHVASEDRAIARHSVETLRGALLEVRTPQQLSAAVKNLLKATSELPEHAAGITMETLDSVLPYLSDDRKNSVWEELQKAANEYPSDSEVWRHCNLMIKKKPLMDVREQLLGTAPAAGGSSLIDEFVAHAADMRTQTIALCARTLLLDLAYAPEGQVNAASTMLKPVLDAMSDAQRSDIVDTVSELLGVRPLADPFRAFPAVEGNPALMDLVGQWVNQEPISKMLVAFAQSLQTAGEETRGELTKELKKLRELVHVRLNDSELDKAIKNQADLLDGGSDMQQLANAFLQMADALKTVEAKSKLNDSLSVLAAGVARKIGSEAGLSTAARDAPRMPADVMVHWILFLSDHASADNSGTLKALENEAKQRYLAHQLALDDVINYLTGVTQRCRSAGLHGAAHVVQDLCQSLPSEQRQQSVHAHALSGDIAQWKRQLDTVKDEIDASNQRQHRAIDRLLKVADVELDVVQENLEENDVLAAENTVIEMFYHASIACAKAGLVRLAEIATLMAKETKTHLPDYFRASQNDAFTQRVFQTAFMDAIMQDPPPSLVAQMRLFGSQCANLIELQDDTVIRDMTSRLHSLIKKKEWFWNEPSTRALADFMAASDPRDRKDALIEFFRRPASGTDCAALMYIARNAILHLLRTPAANGVASWRDQYNDYFSRVVRLRRPLKDNRPVTEKGRNTVGITLPYQPGALQTQGLTRDDRTVVHTRPNLNYPSVTADMLRHGLPYVGDLSGSTAVLMFAFLHMRQTDPRIDMRYVLLSAMLYMVRIGSHAPAEAITVAVDIMQKNGFALDLLRPTPSGTAIPDFKKLVTLVDDPGWKQALENASEVAWAKTLSHVKDYSHYANKSS
jgi:hypothetical protein